MSDRLCCFCTHFYLSMGEPGYSELTPGTDAVIECEAQPKRGEPQGWRMENSEGVEKYRENILKADKCQHWTPIERAK